MPFTFLRLPSQARKQRRGPFGKVSLGAQPIAE